MSKRSKSMVGGSAVAAVLLVAIIGIATLISPVVAENHRHSSVTGYFGLDDGGIPIVDRHGVMLVFDGAIAPETVSVDTFEVSLNDGSFAEIVETRVDGAYVFLRLEDELISDATPIVGIAEGEEVEDLAGNSTNRRKLGFVQIKDGIAPRLTVTLSGGSGRGTGDEGPDRLTNDSIDVRITSDEPLQGAPRVVVVCEGLDWTEIDGSTMINRDIGDFMANRNGPYARQPQEPRGTTYTCGYDINEDAEDDVFELTVDIANSRPGEVWEYAWRNPMGQITRLLDGELVVVAYGRDRSRYDRNGETVSNWSTAIGSFRLDAVFDLKNRLEDVVLIPRPGSTISQSRPFVLIEFPRAASVTLDSVIFDGAEIAADFVVLSGNEFVYWPEPMERGEHIVSVIASDAAGNSAEFHFDFEVVGLQPFVLELQPGWNAISFPATPTGAKLYHAFSDSHVETVVAYDSSGSENSPWQMATRGANHWETNPNFGELKYVHTGKGYWVKSSTHVRQRVSFASSGYIVPDLPTEPTKHPGWNFVGVVDVDGDQTEDHFGDALRIRLKPVLAHEYLGDYEIAYTWDPIVGRFDQLLSDDPMRIGDGIWVYYGSDAN